MGKPIRVAQVMGHMSGGGVESTIMNHYRHIDKNRVQFDFIVDDDSTKIPSEEIEDLGGRIFMVPAYKNLPRYIRECTQVFVSEKPDIVHSNLNALSAFPLYAAQQANVPIRIAHSHSTADFHEILKTCMKLALRPTATRYATHYAACSGLAARWLFGRSKADSGQVHIIKNAINLQQFAYNPGVRRKIRQELNISDETFVIGHVGRLCKQKNQTFLLRVFQDLVRERPDAILLLVGEGPLRTELERVSRELRINKSVRFLGIRDDVEKLYQVFDILAFPSLYEGLGMAVIESQAAGLPVIASTNVPTDAAVTHSPLVQFLPLETGISAWSDKLLTNVHSAREESEVFIEDLVAAGYSIQESADDMQKWYEELLEDHLRSLS